MAENLNSCDDNCELILTRNAKTVYRTAYLRVGNRYDAEDVMQEVFMRYVRYRPEFENTEHEKAWFIRAAINASSTHTRHLSARREVPLEDEVPAPDPAVPDDELLQAIMRLPKSQRSVIQLYYYDGVPTKEIAESLGKSDAAVRIILTRAREKLKKIIEEERRKDQYV